MVIRVYASVGLLLVAASIAIVIVYLCDLIKTYRAKKKMRVLTCPKCNRMIQGGLDVQYCPICGSKLEEGEENA